MSVSVPQYDYLFKFLLVGDAGIGKSALLKRYVDNVFVAEYQTTIGVDFKIKTVTVEGKVIKLQIWDTAGQERFRAITSSYYRGAIGIAVVFDVTNRESFNNLKRWFMEIENYAQPDVEKILVGNKIDLVQARSVKTAEAVDFAQSVGVSYVETSALDGSNVENIFMGLVLGKVPQLAETGNKNRRRERAGSASIPITNIQVEANIFDITASLLIKQTFENVEDVPIEVSFSFPMDEGASVNFFEAVSLTDGTQCTGIIMEQSKASDKYSDAISEGKSAYLLEEHVLNKTRQLRANIGLLSPKEKVEITVGYILEMKVELGKPKLFLVNTTFDPVTRTTLHIPPSIKTSLKIDAFMPSEIKGVECPTGHKFDINIDKNKAKLILQTDSKSFPGLTRDLDLLFSLDKPLLTRGLIAHHKELGSAALIAFMPSVPTENITIGDDYELIFIVDRSGSMEGASWEDARQAVQVFLRSLPNNCRFQIIGFGSTHELMFPESQVYSEKTMKKASDLIKTWGADLQGTELFKPLDIAYSMPKHSSHPNRRVFVITDGQVSNRESIQDIVRKSTLSNPKCKTFALGIGTGVDKILIESTAKSGSGAFELTGPGESIQSKVIRLLKKSLSRQITNISVDWVGLDVKIQSPRVPEDVVLGEKLMIYALLNHPPFGVVIKGILGNNPMEFKILGPDFEQAQENKTVHCLAAKTILRDMSLEERDDAIAISKQFGITSTFTSFVAIPKGKKDTTQENTMELVSITPASAPAYSHSKSDAGGLLNRYQAKSFDSPAVKLSGVQIKAKSGGCCSGVSLPSLPKARPRAQSLSPVVENRPRSATSTSSTKRDTGILDEISSNFQAPPSSPLSPSHSSVKLNEQKISQSAFDEMILLQHADGSWDISDRFCKIIGKSQDAVQGANPKPEMASLWATALALVWLEIVHSDKREVWELLHEKGVSFVDQNKSKAPEVADWIGAARKFL